MDGFEIMGDWVLDRLRWLLGWGPDGRAVGTGRGHRRAVAAVLIYGAVVLAVTMWPAPVDRGHEGAIEWLLGMLHGIGVPRWFGYSALEFTANITMFVPLGLLVGMILPLGSTRLSLLLLPTFSVAIELTQAVVLSQRFASLDDVVANSIGGWIGVLISFAVQQNARTRGRNAHLPHR